jgi:7,8-dihydroneopterin aldolase/epimerase/oxygenase
MPITSSKLFLRDFDVQANIGIHEFEKAGPQRLLISVDLEIDIADYGDGDGDDIRTVIDYDFLRREILDIVSGRHFNLQETLCREIVAIVARHDNVARAMVSIRKPDVYPDCAAVGVEMTYTR